MMNALVIANLVMKHARFAVYKYGTTHVWVSRHLGFSIYVKAQQAMQIVCPVPVGGSPPLLGYPGRSWTATPYISLVTSSAVQGYPRAKGQRCHSPLLWLPVLFMSFFFPSLLLRVSPTCFALTSDFSVGSLWLASTSFRLRGKVGMLGRGPLPCRYRPGSSPTHASTRLIVSSSRNMWRKCFLAERDHAICADGVFVCSSTHVFLFHLRSCCSLLHNESGQNFSRWLAVHKESSQNRVQAANMVVTSHFGTQWLDLK